MGSRRRWTRIGRLIGFLAAVLLGLAVLGQPVLADVVAPENGCCLVAPSGLVNETAGGLTNLSRGSARGSAFFDDFNPGQGFSGVYDEATGSILAFPSGPGGVVPRRGGHAVVNQRLTEAVGAPGSQRAGFTAILQTDGSLQVQWLSRSVNPSGYVPDSLRPAIIDALPQTSGRTVVG